MNAEKRVAQLLVNAGLGVEVIVQIILRIFSNPLAIRYVEQGKIVEAMHVVGVVFVLEDVA